MSRFRASTALALTAIALLAGCGGQDEPGADPLQQVPDTGGLRAQIAGAREVTRADFPATEGRSLDELRTRALPGSSRPAGRARLPLPAGGHRG